MSSRASKKGGGHAEEFVSDLFRSHAWKVIVPPHRDAGGPDLIVAQGATRFAVQVKALSEGRHDRVIPLLSQAILQSHVASEELGNALPLAVICVTEASPSLLRHVEAFAERYARDVSFGIVSEDGVRLFRGPGLEGLNAMPGERARNAAPIVPQAVNLFSDLSQWMLKALLARELPECLIGAPRGAYRSGADLAEAAQVSAMSASRFLSQLSNEGFLDDSSSQIVLVRREELFRRWRAAAMRPRLEVPMRFLLRAPVQQQIQAVLRQHSEDACLGLFAAADTLHIDHVSGVPAYVYVRKLPRPGAAGWPGLAASPQERPDFILRQASFPESTFRGAVHREGMAVSDVIQIWLDVANHPSRGAEQAQHVYDKVLRPMIERGAP
ncbi:RpiR family transcriptional regulator [Variovorax sp. RT4R15]|uniref:RpiR family transcriptional regulator n=1 Tax=Variovorax sp. RT4R15 TaxID=3443737 RepID=UPI003F45332F